MALACLLSAAGTLHASDSVCAEVRIRIDQKLTLERTGFEAALEVANGLSEESLEDFTVELLFSGTGTVTVEATTDPGCTTAHSPDS